MVTVQQIRTFSITLHGLLDYDMDDADEPTTELSLFAECFHEMMMRDYGAAVLQGLLKERCACISGVSENLSFLGFRQGISRVGVG